MLYCRAALVRRCITGRKGRPTRMIYARQGRRGMVSAPHHLAAEAGADILRAGGNAVEAMVAAAAAIAVVYPHMNAIGGDGFWLIAEPGKDPVGIDASGGAAGLASIDFYREQGLEQIPARGPLAALTCAGTVAGWGAALRHASTWGKALPREELMAAAVRHGKEGVCVTRGQEGLTREKLPELLESPGFAATYLDAGGEVLPEGALLKQPALAASLELLPGRSGPQPRQRPGVRRQPLAPLRPGGLSGASGRSSVGRDRQRQALQHAAPDTGRILADDPGAFRPPRRAGGGKLRPYPRFGRSDQAGLHPAQRLARRPQGHDHGPQGLAAIRLSG